MTKPGLSGMFILSAALAGVGGAEANNGAGGSGGAAGQGGAGGQAGASGLVAYYPFSGNAEDENGNGNDASTFGGAALAMDRFGNADSAYELDGTTGYIQVPDSPDFNFNQPLTLTAWIYLNDSASAGIVGQWGPGGFGGAAFVLSVRAGKLRFTLPQPSLYELDSQSTLAAMQWRFVGVVYDGTDVKLFIDGAPDTADTFTAAQVDSDEPLRIGSELSSPSPSSLGVRAIVQRGGGLGL